MRKLFSQKAPSYMFERALKIFCNDLFQLRDSKSRSSTSFLTHEKVVRKSFWIHTHHLLKIHFKLVKVIPDKTILFWKIFFFKYIHRNFSMLSEVPLQWFFYDGLFIWWTLPACIYLFKVNNENTRTMSKIRSNLRLQSRRFGAFTVNFDKISNIVLVFSLLTLNK